MTFSTPRRTLVAVLAIVLVLSMPLFLIGCGRGPQEHGKDKPAETPPVAKDEVAPPGHVEAEAEIKAERAKLIPEDLKLVEAQEFCVVQTDERLGSMGAPVKLMVNGQPVFLCCKGCNRKATSDPEKTLKTLEDNKARAKAKSPARSSLEPSLQEGVVVKAIMRDEGFAGQAAVLSSWPVGYGALTAVNAASIRGVR